MHTTRTLKSTSSRIVAARTAFSVLGLVMALMSITVLSACASLPLQRFGEPQRPGGTLDIEASEAFLERYPFSRKSDLKRLELAMVYLSPESPPHDASKAKGYLWQLAGHEQSPYRNYAVRFLELHTEVERLRSETALKSELLDRQSGEAARLQNAIAAAEDQVAEQSDSARRLQVELQSAHAKLRQLGEDSASKDQEIERLTRELSELKRIDTRQAP